MPLVYECPDTIIVAGFYKPLPHFAQVSVIFPPDPSYFSATMAHKASHCPDCTRNNLFLNHM